MKTTNPALHEDSFNVPHDGTTMTLEGTAFKSFILLILLTLSGSYVFATTVGLSQPPAILWGWVVFGSLLALVMGFICVFNPKSAPITAPAYAVLEGLAVGGVSALFEYMYPLIVVQTVLITLVVFAGLLFVYSIRLVQASENFKLGLLSIMFGILFYYGINFVSRIFFGFEMPLIYDTGWAGIGFSLFICVIAALNYVLDFDFIERGVEQGAPKYMEWYASFGLLVTTVWLYLEILRLLGKIRSNN